jgi:hypothetical protein
MQDDQYVRHVGYRFPGKIDYLKDYYFTQRTVDAISYVVTSTLREELPNDVRDNRDVLVPDPTIMSVMNAIYRAFRPSTGDIHGGRYSMMAGGPRDEAYFNEHDPTPENYITNMTKQVIETIVQHVKVSLLTDRTNHALNIWDATVTLGDGNKLGLRQHEPIKLRGINKRPQPLQINMRY